MKALSDALEEPSAFPGGVRWVRRSGSPPLDAVVNFMELAANRGVDAQWVIAETFDELAADIERQVDLPAALAGHVRERRPQSPPPLPTRYSQHGSPFPVLRLSALPVVALPRSARVIRLASAITTRDARSLLKAANVHGVVASLGSSVLAFGSDASLLAALAPAGPESAGEAPLDPGGNSTHLGLLYDAVVKALARRLPLRPILSSRGHSIVVGAPRPGETIERRRSDAGRLSNLKNAYGSELFGVVPNTSLRFAEGIQLSFEHYAERWWCVFDPYTWVELLGQPTHSEFGPEVEWRRERWATRRNKWWSGALDAWSHLLLGEAQERELTALWFADEPGINATFTVARTNGWSRPSGRDSR